MNFIDFFEKTRIVNLDTRGDRRKETRYEFSKNDFVIDGEKVAFYSAIKPLEKGEFPSIGCRGCFESHLNILKEALAAGWENILILEDDIAFSRKIRQYGAIAVKMLGDIQWDFIYPGYLKDSDKGELMWKPLTEPLLATHCYAVNKRIIKRLVDFLELVQSRPYGHLEGGPMHYDGALNTFFQQNEDIRIFYFTHNLGYQRPSKTDLHTESWFEDKPIFKSLLIFLRMIKRCLYRVIY